MLSSSASPQLARGLASEVLANGDWSSPKFCHVETGCCPDRLATKTLVCKYLVPAVTSDFRVVPRHKWTGSEHVVRGVVLLQAMHGLFAQALQALLGPKVHPTSLSGDALDCEPPHGGVETPWAETLAKQASIAQQWAQSGHGER